MTKINLEELFATENEQLQKLNDIVAKSIEEEKPMFFCVSIQDLFKII